MLISKFGGANISDKIDEFEDLIDKKVPVQLREFLIKYNGGETPNTRFKNSGISSDVRYFLGMGKVKNPFDSSMIFEHNGNYILPFAFDSFGNNYGIDFLTGEIFFYDHENNSVKKVSKDLREFIEKCESDGVKQSSVKSVEEREQELIKRGRGSIITDALRDMWRAEIAKFGSMKLEDVNI